MNRNHPEQQVESYVEKQIEEGDHLEYPKHKDIDTADNSSMVNDMEDLKQLGEDMEEMSTPSEDEEQGIRNDPEQ